MTNVDLTNPHQGAVVATVLAARMLATTIEDLPAVIRAAERALDFGPFTDPTAWRDKHKALEQDIEMLKAALPMWQLGRRMLERAELAEAATKNQAFTERIEPKRPNATPPPAKKLEF